MSAFDRVCRILVLKVFIVGRDEKYFLANFICVALTIGRIARYRDPFIAFEIYVKCIESLGHFYSIEIRSMPRSFLCFAIVAGFDGATSMELSSVFEPQRRYGIFRCQRMDGVLSFNVYFLGLRTLEIDSLTEINIYILTY